MTSAVIYDRVSTERQGQGYSLITQLNDCRAYCERMGYTIVGEFEDQHTSTVKNRPGLDEMFKRLARGDVDVVVAWNSSRLLGRDDERIVQALTKREIFYAGAVIEYATNGRRVTPNPDDGDDAANELDELIDRMENRRRRKWTMAGKRTRAESGFVMPSGGPVPYGYGYRREEKKGWLEINEAEAAVVRDMFHWLTIEGLSCHVIAKRLHELGIPTREDTTGHRRKQSGASVWNPTVVAGIFRNATYKGEYAWGKTRRVKRRAELKPDGTLYKTAYVNMPTDPSEWIVIPVPAIVDAGTWERAQARLAENKQFAKPPLEPFLLRGLLTCPECGGRWVTEGRSSGSRHRYYRCSNGKGYPWQRACDASYRIRADRLEAAVWAFVTDYLLHPDRLMVDIDRRRQEESVEHARHERRLKALDAELAIIDRRLSELLDQVLDGFPAAIIDAKKQELLDKRQRFAAERAELAAAPVTITPAVVDMLEQVAAQVEQLLPVMTTEDRAALLRALRIKIVILDSETVQLRGVMSDELLCITS